MVTGKEFRVCLKNKSKKPRWVSPFSQQSLQPNTRVFAPPRSFVYKERPRISLFRKYFDRGDIPICRAYDKRSGPKTFLMWRIPPKDLDYAHYLPMFFDGLCESVLPYKKLARCGVHDMLDVGGDKILPVVPQLIIPIKNALDTRIPEVMIETMKALQHLLMTGPYTGEALVPYFRQILPMFNLFRDININIGDKIDYDRHGHIGDLVNETLQLLEKCGGPDAFINIKYMVPTYESCVNN